MSNAAWCERATAMLEAGLSDSRIIEVLGQPPTGSADAGAIRASWSLCRESGSRLAPLMRSCGQNVREWDRVAHERATAIAGPKLTTRIMLGLPLVTLLASSALGLNAIGALVEGPIGWLCLITGSLFLVAGWRWSRRLIARAERAAPAPGFASDAIAALLESGLPPPRAIALLERYWPDGARSARSALTLADRVGLPPVHALRAEAHAQRDEALATARRQAARLAVQLTLPLGSCVLPAYLAWGIAPVVLSMIRSASAG